MKARSSFAFMSEDELNVLYPPPSEQVVRATTDHLTDFHLDYLAKATFFVIASGSEEGFDASPRGGSSGIVQSIDRRTICFADWPGNNKIETLRNIVRNPAVGLMFLFPGLDIFMRINGRAGVTTDVAVLDRLLEGERRPKAAVVVDIDDVYFHCGKAINRAGLWKADNIIDRKSVPSPGAMMKELAKITDMTAQELEQYYDDAMRNDLYG